MKLTKTQLKEIIREEIQRLSEGRKFSTKDVTIYGMDYVFAYPDENGIETEQGLYNWESKDIANRELYFVKDEKDAIRNMKAFAKSKRVRR